MRRLAVLVATAAALACAAPAWATFPGANGRIAFSRGGQGIWDIQPDGTGERRLSPQTAAAGCDSAPAYSPNGLLIAFESCGAQQGISVMSSEGLERRQVTSAGEPSFPRAPAFSPQGDRIAFHAGRYQSGIYTQALDGSPAQQVTALGEEPAWSSLGALAFAQPLRPQEFCNATDLQDLYSIAAPGARPRRITKTYGSFDADWSPSGQQIAFTRDVTLSKADFRRARKGPDCKRLVRAAAAPYGDEVMVANANGRGMRRLTTRGGYSPVWSPDGTQIAFERRPFIYVMNADGSGLRRLTRGRDPAWQPLPAPVPAPTD